MLRAPSGAVGVVVCSGWVVVDDERATREETASLLMNVEWFGIVTLRHRAPH